MIEITQDDLEAPTILRAQDVIRAHLDMVKGHIRSSGSRPICGFDMLGLYTLSTFNKKNNDAFGYTASHDKVICETSLWDQKNRTKGL